MMLNGNVATGGELSMDIDHPYRAGWDGEKTFDLESETWFANGKEWNVRNAAELKILGTVKDSTAAESLTVQMTSI